MSLDTLKDLFEDQIKDLYSAENQLTKALPKMAKAASNEKLRKAFEDHLEETKGHVDRLKQIAESRDFSVGRKKCKAMEGLVEEGKEVMEEDGDESVIDAALIGAAQRVEHYEMAAYGMSRALAELLGYSDAAKILQTTLDEEGAANEKLGTLAKTINKDALSSGGNDSNTANTKSKATAGKK